MAFSMDRINSDRRSLGALENVGNVPVNGIVITCAMVLSVGCRNMEVPLGWEATCGGEAGRDKRSKGILSKAVGLPGVGFVELNSR